MSKSFFISYTSADKAWAHWVGWTIRDLGHDARVHEWEVGWGGNIPGWMEQALSEADGMVAIASDAYFKATYSIAEREAASWAAVSNRPGFVKPLQVAPVSTWPIFMSPTSRRDLRNLERADARALLETALQDPAAPLTEPIFPGGGEAMPAPEPDPLPTSEPRLENGVVVIDAGLSAGQHERMLQNALEDLRADLERAHAAERRADQAEAQLEVQTLQTQIAEYERRLAEPEQAYRDYQAKIAELEALLGQSTAEIGDNRIKAAQAALHEGRYAEADAIFAEVEDHEAAAVKRAAEAAYGRGLIAEEQVRWADAADHFKKAARLDPTYDTLIKAREFLWRSGRYADSVRYGEDLVRLARGEFGNDHEKTGTALNELGLSYDQIGNYEQAEPLFREALEISRAALGDAHNDTAISLNNLAALLHATGRTAEAEPLYREALEITRAALGDAHADTAISLNSLGRLLQDIGKQEEAEPLMREAVRVMEAALGPEHPHSKMLRANLQNFLAERAAE